MSDFLNKNNHIGDLSIELDKLMEVINNSDTGFNVKQETYHKNASYAKKYWELKYMIEKLESDRYIYRTDIFKGDIKANDDWSYKLTLDGVLFLENGGYKNRNKKVRLNNTWVVVKIIANIINAVSIMSIAFLSYMVSKDTKLKDDKIELQEREIGRLTSKLDTHKYKIHNNSIKDSSNTDGNK
ncbi:hypothetical protein EMA8858_04188 [Emticicia aquatica]|uniref:Uncharacterized protein n=1 Tax=Emticicia aquatica TaxID=1681835 RepID=A0ABM9AWX2_9BACT|nr:hypothetical protein [Emticicia aquatica]CAH0998053.1 hypothetical protein EMA8858_04188 [Emticicia aquatica]